MSKINLPVLFKQNDPQWGSKPLGFNTDPKFNLRDFGCLVASLSSIAKYYGKDTNPDLLNEALKLTKGFVNGGSYIWGALNKMYPDIEETKTNTPKELTDSQMKDIQTSIDQGYPVVLCIDYNQKTLGLETHYVVAVDYNPNNENDFTIFDPLDGQIKSLHAYLGWFRPNARKAIEQYIIYKGKVPKIESVNATPLSPELKEGSMVISIKDNERNIQDGANWRAVCAYLELDPNTTTFDQVKSTIAGYKSLKTDYENRRAELEQEMAKLKQEVENKAEQVGRLEFELTNQVKLGNERFANLNKAIKQIGENDILWQGKYNELYSRYDSAMKEKGEALNKLAGKKAELEIIEKVEKKIEKIEKIDWLKVFLLYPLEDLFRIKKDNGKSN